MIDPAGLARLAPLVLAAWFVTISAMVLFRLGGTDIGLDATNYIGATRAWLSGGDPWAGMYAGFHFAAPPPTLLVTLPFALLPGDLGWFAMMAVGPVLAVIGIRLLKLPAWWIAWPPLMIACYAGNPAAWLPALMVVAAPIAVIAKVYATIPLVLLGRWRELVAAAAIIGLTMPFLPWGTFLGDFPAIVGNLSLQNGPGMAGPMLPSAILLGVILLRDRSRAAWLSVPVLWPHSEWDYSTLALPTGAVMCAILAVPYAGAPFVALAVATAIAARGSKASGLGSVVRMFRPKIAVSLVRNPHVVVFAAGTIAPLGRESDT